MRQTWILIKADRSKTLKRHNKREICRCRPHGEINGRYIGKCVGSGGLGVPGAGSLHGKGESRGLVECAPLARHCTGWERNTFLISQLSPIMTGMPPLNTEEKHLLVNSNANFAEIEIHIPWYAIWGWTFRICKDIMKWMNIVYSLFKKNRNLTLCKGHDDFVTWSWEWL